MYVYLTLLYKHRFYVFMQADKMLVKNSENLLDAIAKMLSAAEATSVKVRFCAYNRGMVQDSSRLVWFIHANRDPEQ